MKQCTDMEYELITLIKGKPVVFDESLSYKILTLMDNIRCYDDIELKEGCEVSG